MAARSLTWFLGFRHAGLDFAVSADRAELARPDDDQGEPVRLGSGAATEDESRVLRVRTRGGVLVLRCAAPRLLEQRAVIMLSPIVRAALGDPRVVGLLEDGPMLRWVLDPDASPPVPP